MEQGSRAHRRDPAARCAAGRLRRPLPRAAVRADLGRGAEYDVVINNHGGTSGPEPPGAGKFPSSGAMFMVETSWFSHRTLWQFIFSGIFERYPNLKLALTEQGTGWVPGTLAMLDDFHARFTSGKQNMETVFAGEAARELSLTPSEYFRRNVFMGSSFHGERLRGKLQKFRRRKQRRNQHLRTGR